MVISFFWPITSSVIHVNGRGRGKEARPSGGTRGTCIRAVGQSAEEDSWRYKFIGNFYLFVCKTGGQTGDYRKEDEDEEDTEELVKESI